VVRRRFLRNQRRGRREKEEWKEREMVRYRSGQGKVGEGEEMGAMITEKKQPGVDDGSDRWGRLVRWAPPVRESERERVTVLGERWAELVFRYWAKLDLLWSKTSFLFFFFLLFFSDFLNHLYLLHKSFKQGQTNS
jgi:hypothetical protein